MKKFLSRILIACMMLTMAIPFSVAYAQTASQDAQRKILEAELAKIEAEIVAQQAELAKQKSQTGSISNEIKILTTQINAKKLEIQKKNKVLQDLELDIRDRNQKLDSLDQDLSNEKRSLAQLIRNQHSLESYSIVELLLQGQTISEFYKDIDDYDSIKQGMDHSFKRIVSLQEKTTTEKEQLISKKDEEVNVKHGLEQDKKKVELTQGEKQSLLKVSQTKEKSYEQVIAERKAAAASVRQALFQLRGVSGGALNFGQVYELAKEAGNDTGVRPAFIMAILKQETNFGANTGSCYLKDPSTGDGVSVSTGEKKPRTMKPDRDVGPFMLLAEKLGFDSSSMRVSCWIPSYNNGVPTGWGGAMGISQFIPSTWAGYGGLVKDSNGTWSYDASRDRIRNALKSGVMSNPSVNLHGVTATALYMKDLGATAQTYSAERNAACRYYSGRVCDTPGVKNAFYGNSVMKYATEIQSNIDVLENAN